MNERIPILEPECYFKVKYNKYSNEAEITMKSEKSDRKGKMVSQLIL